MSGELAAALVAAQKDMPKVEKTAKANYGMYATLDHLIAKTRPVLTKHGLAIQQWPSRTEAGQPTLTTVLLHTSGEAMEYEMPLLLAKNDMQGLGAAITYARRYAWSAVCGISTEDDDDAQSITAPAASPIAADGGGGAASAPAPPDVEVRFPSGKHQGKTFGEVPADYLDWYAKNGPREDIRAAIGDYFGAVQFEPAPPEDDIIIPF